MRNEKSKSVEKTSSPAMQWKSEIKWIRKRKRVEAKSAEVAISEVGKKKSGIWAVNREISFLKHSEKKSIFFENHD